MDDKDLKKLFKLLEKLYLHQQKLLGMITPIPYCYAKNNTGGLVIFSAFGTPSKQIELLLESTFK